MKKIGLLVIAIFFSSSLAMAEDRVTGVGATTGLLVGGLVGSQLGGGKGGHFAAGVAGAVIGSLIGNELEEKARAPKDPVSHRCPSWGRPIEIVSATMPDTRACLLNEQYEEKETPTETFVGWTCPKTHPRHALGVGNNPLCLATGTFVEADTIRQNNGYAVKSQPTWWPCPVGTGQDWENRNGQPTPVCRVGNVQLPQPSSFQNAHYTRGFARGVERQEREARRSAERAGYNDGIGQQTQSTSGGLFRGRVATFQ